MDKTNFRKVNLDDIAEIAGSGYLLLAIEMDEDIEFLKALEKIDGHIR